MKPIELWQGDCLELMKNIPDGSVDLVLTDPPYGTTACKWDSVIPFEPMWEQLNRIIKPSGINALFANQPFTSTLISSNIEKYKYNLVWMKNRGTGFQYAKSQPMRQTEDICIFYDNKPPFDTTTAFDGLKRYMISEREKTGLSNSELKELLQSNMARHYFTTKSQFTIPIKSAYEKLQSTGFFQRPYEGVRKEFDEENEKIKAKRSVEQFSTYNPQMIKLDKPVKYKKASSCNTISGIENKKEYYWVDETYPTNVLEFAKVSKPTHPTQKPIALLEYLIKTYTNEGETVLDFTMGSGSTGVACVNTNRRFIGIELDEGYLNIAKKRIEEAERLNDE